MTVQISVGISFIKPADSVLLMTGSLRSFCDARLEPSRPRPDTNGAISLEIRPVLPPRRRHSECARSARKMRPISRLAKCDARAGCSVSCGASRGLSSFGVEFELRRQRTEGFFFCDSHMRHVVEWGWLARGEATKWWRLPPILVLARRWHCRLIATSSTFRQPSRRSVGRGGDACIYAVTVRAVVLRHQRALRRCVAKRHFVVRLGGSRRRLPGSTGIAVVWRRWRLRRYCVRIGVVKYDGAGYVAASVCRGFCRWRALFGQLAAPLR